MWVVWLVDQWAAMTVELMADQMVDCSAVQWGWMASL
jgi:hypothetical protein